jgi:aerobic-type carbon monoxide dehydrogenase small subunit (CoxS/CutS family)
MSVSMLNAFGQRLNLRLRVNGIDRELASVDARVSLLDLLRERLDLTGAKKGCDRGGCERAIDHE